MSTAARALGGVQIDVDKLFAVSVDFGHLRVTILAILDALGAASARAEAAERAAASCEARVVAMEKRAADSSAKLQRSEESLEAASVQLREMGQKEAASTARMAEFEHAMHEMHEMQMHFPETIAQQTAKIAHMQQAVERSEKEMRALVAQGNDKMGDLERAAADAESTARAAQAAAAAATERANSAAATNATNTASPVVAPTPAPAPTAVATPPSSNNDAALMQRTKMLSLSLEALAARVATLESISARPPPIAATALAAARASMNAGNSGNGSGNGNNGMSDAERTLLADLSDASAHSSQQLAVTLGELSKIQGAIASLQSDMEGKADRSDLLASAAGGSKAPSDAASLADLRALQNQTNKQAETIRALERQVADLQAQMNESQENSRNMAARIEAIMDSAPMTSSSSSSSASKRASAVPSYAPAHTIASSSDCDELRRWAEDQFGLLSRKEKAARVDTHELFAKDKDLRSKVDALVRAQKTDKDSVGDMTGALKRLEAELRALVGAATSQNKAYTDSRVDEILFKLREMERALDKGMKSELKRFEKDVLVFMDSGGANGSDGHNGHNGHGHGHDAAVGKIHFRCLSCDQTVGNLQGPSSLLYARAVGGGSGTTIPLQQIASGSNNPASTSMSIDRGRELYLSGRDGAVYKGRDPSTVSIAAQDPSRPAQFQVHYNGATGPGPTTNARGSTIVDHKTVSAPYAHRAAGAATGANEQQSPNTPQARIRPGSATYEDPAALMAGGGGSSARNNGGTPAGLLPPTRPVTRGGLRSREEQKTPLREQLNSSF